MAVELETERLFCKRTRQFLYLHWPLKFDMCDGRRCAELTLSNLDTQTSALDSPMQELVVNKRWIIQNSAGRAWNQSCRRPPKITNDWTGGRDRFAQAAQEPEDEEPQRKRHRPEGEGRQSLAPPGEGGSSSSGSCSALPPPPAPPPALPPLEPPPLANLCLEQETEMTDATVEQQGETKRRREHPEVPQAADSSSSSSESSTDTEMDLVDVCTILRDNSEAEGRCQVRKLAI